MEDRVYGRLTFLTTRYAVVFFVVVCVLCRVGFDWRAKHLGNKETFDTQKKWYTACDAHKILKALDESGRSFYAVTELTLDAVFPIAYGSLFAGLIGNLYARRPARVLVAVPVGAVLADAVENVLAVYLVWLFKEDAEPPRLPQPVVAACAVATWIKWRLAACAVCFVALGIVWRALICYSCECNTSEAQ